jgi:hypothetical protein
VIKEVVKEIFPPEVPAVIRWRLVVFAVCLAFALHILWARGMIPGVSGFAYASDVAKLRASVETILKMQLEDRLRNLQSEKCRADSEALKRVIQIEIDRLQHEHKQLDGTIYTLTRCRVKESERFEGE